MCRKRYHSQHSLSNSLSCYYVASLSLPDAAGLVNTTWDSRASPEDMEAMWNHPVVNKEWTKSGEKLGKVRLSHDTEKRPYVSRAEMRVR